MKYILASFVIPNNNTSMTDNSISIPTTNTPKPAEENFDDAELKEMVEAGLIYGRKKSTTHPRMKPFIFSTRNNIEIIDLTKTLEHLEKALVFLKEIIARKGHILFVGTQSAARLPIEELAKKFSSPYVINRWLGGTLTNFNTINTRMNYFKNLREEEASGALGKYTKKERVKFNKEIGRLQILFGGLLRLTQPPEALFVINTAEHSTAVREARRMKIPVVALMSTDQDPELVEYPIIGNDTAPASIAWIIRKVDEALTNTPQISEAGEVSPVGKGEIKTAVEKK